MTESQDIKPYQPFHITNKALIVHRNKLMFAKSNEPEYFGALECPGGRTDVGERVQDAMKRELKEEIGLDLNLIPHTIDFFTLHQRDAKEYGHDGITQIMEIYYAIKIPDNIELQVVSKPEENSGFVWIDKDTDIDSEFKYRLPTLRPIFLKAQKELLS